MTSGQHQETEDVPWKINLNNHPARANSKAYTKARAQLKDFIVDAPFLSLVGLA